MRSTKTICLELFLLWNMDKNCQIDQNAVGTGIANGFLNKNYDYLIKKYQGLSIK
jgi:hypothetical protein